MNIVLTGATGYLGSHLLMSLIGQNYNVVILKRSFSNSERILPYLHKIHVVDVDTEDVEKAFQFFPIDLILHTATCYGRKEERPADIFFANTFFPLTLLDLAIKFEVKFFFNTDTSLNSITNDYAFSKKQFQMWGKHLAVKKKIKFLNLLLEHMYGPGEDSGKFISYLMQSLKNNVAVLPLTEGTQKRDFIYIDDVIAAFMVLINSLNSHVYDFYQDISIGTGEAISIKSLVKTLHQLMQASTKLGFGMLPLREGEPELIVANNAFLRSMGWQPKYSIEQGLLKLRAII